MAALVVHNTSFSPFVKKFLPSKKGHTASFEWEVDEGTLTGEFSADEYEWFMDHPFRRSIFKELDEDLQIAYLMHKGEPTSCTVSAYTVFSTIAERSIEKKDPSFLKKKDFYLLNGVSTLAQKIAELTKKQGLTALCSIDSAYNEEVHQFVLEISPTKELYIYQSYFEKYTLEQWLKKQKPMQIDQVIKKLKLLTGPVSKERDQIYTELFQAAIDEKSAKGELTFHFLSFEYSEEDIPLSLQGLTI